MAKVNHYKVLNLKPSATTEEIKAAYKLLSKKLHPDVPGGSTAKFQQLTTSYAVLKDPLKKSLYDRELEEQRKAQSFSNIKMSTSNQYFTRPTYVYYQQNEKPTSVLKASLVIAFLPLAWVTARKTGLVEFLTNNLDNAETNVVTRFVQNSLPIELIFLSSFFLFLTFLVSWSLPPGKILLREVSKKAQLITFSIIAGFAITAELFYNPMFAAYLLFILTSLAVGTALYFAPRIKTLLANLLNKCVKVLKLKVSNLKSKLSR